jgi:hypothetical protein
MSRNQPKRNRQVFWLEIGQQLTNMIKDWTSWRATMKKATFASFVILTLLAISAPSLAQQAKQQRWNIDTSGWNGTMDVKVNSDGSMTGTMALLPNNCGATTQISGHIDKTGNVSFTRYCLGNLSGQSQLYTGVIKNKKASGTYSGVDAPGSWNATITSPTQR